jgi:hypothetical protein
LQNGLRTARLEALGSNTAEIARLVKVDQASVERMAEHCDSAFDEGFHARQLGRSLPVTALDNFDQNCMMAFMQG